MPVTSFVDTKVAVRQDLTIEQGTDLDVPITIEGLNVTGYTAKLQVRTAIVNGDLLYEMSTENGKISTADGTVKLMFDAPDFEGISWRVGYYDLKITSGTGKPTRIMEGKFYVDPEVTQ